ncbi:helix-turn-helix domain-containing protein, partial [Azospirillum sp. B506]|uniref:helix-turn-helix domain-containing protein n=1 Tax=Azospirillum sp. B506 TaxID=137721 RepID=UPI0005B2ABDE
PWQPGAEGLRLDIKLSQQQLGCLVGVSRESVNKLLNEWQRAGVIEMDAGYIVILDSDALDDIAESCG